MDKQAASHPTPEPVVLPDVAAQPHPTAHAVEPPARPGRDVVDVMGEDSFPASDSPSFTPLTVGPPACP